MNKKEVLETIQFPIEVDQNEIYDSKEQVLAKGRLYAQEEETIVFEILCEAANEKYAPKLPLEKLADDLEMSGQIAKLLGLTLVSSSFKKIADGVVVIYCKGEGSDIKWLEITCHGEMQYSDDSTIPNCLQIARLILSKYTIPLL